MRKKNQITQDLLSLEEKVVIIAGAASGIGLATSNLFSRAMAIDHGKQGIRVNCVCLYPT